MWAEQLLKASEGTAVLSSKLPSLFVVAATQFPHNRYNAIRKARQSVCEHERERRSLLGVTYGFAWFQLVYSVCRCSTKFIEPI